jgi:hypothetical protein
VITLRFLLFPLPVGWNPGFVVFLTEWFGWNSPEAKQPMRDSECARNGFACFSLLMVRARANPSF